MTLLLMVSSILAPKLLSILFPFSFCLSPLLSANFLFKDLSGLCEGSVLLFEIYWNWIFIFLFKFWGLLGIRLIEDVRLLNAVPPTIYSPLSLLTFIFCLWHSFGVELAFLDLAILSLSIGASVCLFLFGKLSLTVLLGEAFS